MRNSRKRQSGTPGLHWRDVNRPIKPHVFKTHVYPDACEHQQHQSKSETLLLGYSKEYYLPWTSELTSVMVLLQENLNDSNMVDGARPISDTPVSAKDSQSFNSGEKRICNRQRWESFRLIISLNICSSQGPDHRASKGLAHLEANLLPGADRHCARLPVP